MKAFRKVAVAVALSVMGLWSGVASAQVTLPDIGVDVGAYVTAAIVAIGGVVAVVIGGKFAFLLVQKGFKWARGM